MSVSTAPMEWLEDLVLDLSGLDVMPDLDPGLLDWDPTAPAVAA